MAETYAQRKAVVVKSLRGIRNRYRVADTAGEKLERTLDRLLERKTLISPEQLARVVDQYETYLSAVQQVQNPIADTVSVSTVVA
jgi:hypothetical protein